MGIPAYTRNKVAKRERAEGLLPCDCFYNKDSLTFKSVRYVKELLIIMKLNLIYMPVVTAFLFLIMTGCVSMEESTPFPTDTSKININ